jgi:hypothetical protein
MPVLICCTVPVPTPNRLAIRCMPALSTFAFTRFRDGARKAGADTFLDHRALELREDTHHLKHGLSDRRRGVDPPLVKVEVDLPKRRIAGACRGLWRR